MNPNNKIPPGQVLIYVIDQARTALDFLKELEAEWKKTRVEKKDGSLIRKRQRVIADAFVVYIASLFDKTENAVSFVRSYPPHKFIDDFMNTELVKKCIIHRNNRSGHQSEQFGHVISLDLILSSEVEKWLEAASFAVATRQLPIRDRKNKK